MSDIDDNKPVDDKFLEAMGLGHLQGAARDEAIQDLLYTININVGRRIIGGLDRNQAAEFERLSAPGADVEKLIYWIALNVPNYEELVEEEIRKLRDGTLSFVDEMMAKSRPVSDGGDQ